MADTKHKGRLWQARWRDDDRAILEELAGKTGLGWADVIRVSIRHFLKWWDHDQRPPNGTVSEGETDTPTDTPIPPNGGE